MSTAKNTLLLGFLVAAVTGCNQPAAPEAQPAATAAVAATPAAKPAPPSGQVPGVLTAKQVAEKRLPQQASCNIETVNAIRFKNAPFLAPGKSVVFSGWLLPEISKKTGVDAEIRVLDPTGTAGWQYKINRWIPRPDVNAAMKGLDEGHSGFDQPADLSSLPPGTYKVLVTFRDGGTPYVCDNGRQLQIQ